MSAELEEFTGRSFKVPKGGIRSIVNFIAIGACAKRPFLAESCCYQKYVSMKMYVLKGVHNQFMGSVFY